MGKLAITGGKPVRDSSVNPWPRWPVWGEDEQEALSAVLDSGVWSYNGAREIEFVKRWARFCGTEHAVAVANGTVALQLALEALDIGWGDEVIVPGLTWQATAAAVVDVNAVPILVDVEPDTWCLSPAAVEAAITPRTRAIIPVHLYGCVADMDAITNIAQRHNLSVIEDCAHQHGSQWRDKPVGSLGIMGCFSMQLSKILTAGEGGAITTSDAALWVRLDALRNCGRLPATAEPVADKGSGQYGSRGDLIQSGNFRISEFQAALLLAGLKRLPDQNRRRAHNAAYLNRLLAEIPGLKPMREDPRTTRQAYFNFAWRYDRSVFGGLPVEKFRAALAAELGLTVEPCYEPLNDCRLYRPRTKKRYKISPEHWAAIDPRRFSLPACIEAYRECSVVIHHSALMGPKADMELVAAAIRKIGKNLNELVG